VVADSNNANQQEHDNQRGQSKFLHDFTALISI
jgi:hypothetical protein